MAKNKKKQVEKVLKLNQELNELLEKESNEYVKAIEKGKNIIVINRKGKRVKVSENELWEEIRIVGSAGEAGKIMSKKYKKLFKIAEERSKKNTELQNFMKTEFEIDVQQMSIGNYLKLTMAVVDYKIDELREELRG